MPPVEPGEEDNPGRTPGLKDKEARPPKEDFRFAPTSAFAGMTKCGAGRDFMIADWRL
jgi:hypothetical protein